MIIEVLLGIIAVGIVVLVLIGFAIVGELMTLKTTLMECLWSK